MENMFVYSLRFIVLFFVSLSFLLAVIAPIAVYAQLENTPSSGALLKGVDCSFGEQGKKNCGVKHLYILAGNVVTLLIWLATLGVALVILWYGVMLAMNTFFGDYNAILQKAKRSLLWSLAGLTLVLGAWLIVQFFFETLGYRDAKNLFKYNPAPSASSFASTSTSARLTAAVNTTPSLSASPTGIALSTVSEGCIGRSCVCNDCTALPATIPCKERECQVDTVLGSKLANLNTKTTLAHWRVTEAFPPTTNRHRNVCHYNGTCVDINFTDTSTVSAGKITNFIEAARSSGLRAVYEVGSSNQRDILIREGVPSESIIIAQNITAPHFSVYRD